VKAAEEAASSRLTAVEDTQHHEPIAVVPILEHVRGVEHFQNELSIFLTTRERPAKLRMSGKNLRFGDDLLSHDPGELGSLLVKKRRESIEVGEGVGRPLEIY
jgi:hypothetical protein